MKAFYIKHVSKIILKIWYLQDTYEIYLSKICSYKILALFKWPGFDAVVLQHNAFALSTRGPTLQVDRYFVDCALHFFNIPVLFVKIFQFLCATVPSSKYRNLHFTELSTSLHVCLKNNTFEYAAVSFF